MWQCPCSGGCRWRSVARQPTIRSRAADITTTRSASAIGGSPWVHRSLSPRSATARLRTTIEPITAAHRTGIASERSDGPTVSPIDANDQRSRSPGRIRPPASSIDPTDVSTRPAAADAEHPRCRSLERSDTEQQAQDQPDDQDETTHAFEAHQRQRPIGDRDVAPRMPFATRRAPMPGVPVRGRSRAGRRSPPDSCRGRGRDGGCVRRRDSSWKEPALQESMCEASTWRARVASDHDGDNDAGDHSEHLGRVDDGPQRMRAGTGEPCRRATLPRRRCRGRRRRSRAGVPCTPCAIPPFARVDPAMDRTNPHRHRRRPA